MLPIFFSFLSRLAWEKCFLVSCFLKSWSLDGWGDISAHKVNGCPIVMFAVLLITDVTISMFVGLL